MLKLTNCEATSLEDLFPNPPAVVVTTSDQRETLEGGIELLHSRIQSENLVLGAEDGGSKQGDLINTANMSSPLTVTKRKQTGSQSKHSPVMNVPTDRLSKVTSKNDKSGDKLSKSDYSCNL